MPNADLSDAIKEAFASVPTDITILHTLEINHPAVSSFRDKLDLCFVVDTTGSMGGLIDTVKDNITALVAALEETFTGNIRYALVDFKDEDETYVPTGPAFVNLATFEAALDALVASGGGDGPENGYGAVVMGCEELDWRTSRDVGRAMVLFTDIQSHERGATKAEAISSLVLRDIIFSYLGPEADESSGGDYVYVGETGGDYNYVDAYYSNVGEGNGEYVYNSEFDYYDYVGPGNGDFNYIEAAYVLADPAGTGQYDLTPVVSTGGYGALADATGGLQVESETFLADLIEAITLSSEVEGSELFIIQDKKPWTLTLEDARVVDFEPVGFRFRLPGAGDNGLQELSISIDNVDRRLSDFIDLVKDYNTPVTLTYRPYLSSDTSGPQMVPPLKLYLRDVVITPFEVNGRATFADVINKKFPSELYTRSRFPSLGD